MILEKIIHFLLVFNRQKNHTTYYKLIKYQNKNGCVETNTTQRVAESFNALPGTCREKNCNVYKGKYTLPFCCKVHGYECIN